VRAEAKFNERGEPTITMFPESQEEIDILCTMRGKHRREDGNHMLVMGVFINEGVIECATFTTNPLGHPTTFLSDL
jgi:hypothetical protein